MAANDTLNVLAAPDDREGLRAHARSAPAAPRRSRSRSPTRWPTPAPLTGVAFTGYVPRRAGRDGGRGDAGGHDDRLRHAHVRAGGQRPRASASRRHGRRRRHLYRHGERDGAHGRHLQQHQRRRLGDGSDARSRAIRPRRRLTVAQATLTKAFAPATIDQGGVSTLTFTLTNGGRATRRSRASTSPTRCPANVVVAAAPTLASTCPSGTGVIAATAGSGDHHRHRRHDDRGAGLAARSRVNVTSSDRRARTTTRTPATSRPRRGVTTTGVNATLTVPALPTLTKAFAPSDRGHGPELGAHASRSRIRRAHRRARASPSPTRCPAGAIIGTPNGVDEHLRRHAHVHRDGGRAALHDRRHRRERGRSAPSTLHDHGERGEQHRGAAT